MRIVVAEDQQDEASRLVRLLTTLGHHVNAVGTGPEAVRACLDSHPQLVFLDLLLPGLDGFEVARQLRASRSSRAAVRSGQDGHPALVAITGLRSAAAEDVARSVGFGFFLRKPYTVEDLRVLLATISADGRFAPAQEGKS